jgi:hypothetical protein
MNAAEKVYGERIVKDALRNFNDPNMGAIGGLMIQRGYLTMDHVAELLGPGCDGGSSLRAWGAQPRGQW